MVNLKRIYRIIFENRSYEEIRNDYYNNKWISKSELTKLLQAETEQFITLYDAKTKEVEDLLSSFNMNALANYELLERKHQGTLKNK